MDKKVFSHYVTRSLTQPWEQGDRSLIFYDFDTSNLAEHASKKLLTIYGLLNPEQEQFFSKHAEQPLGILKAKYLASKQILNQKVLHSPFIYFILQLERIRLAKQPSEPEINVFDKGIFKLTDKGYGASTLVEALKQIKTISRVTGIKIVIVDALNISAASFYKNFGFIEFDDDPMRLFIIGSSSPF